MDIGDLGFSQNIIDGYIFRTFSSDIEEDKLYWHKDKENRILFVIDGIGWKLQMDDELPISLVKNGIYSVPKETFHRLHKGETSLVLKIKEF